MSLWKKEHNFPFPFYKVRQPSQLEVNFLLKIIPLGEKEGLIILPKDLKHGLGRGSIKNDNDDDNDDDDEDDDNDDYDDWDVFSWCQLISNTIGTIGGG